MALPPTLDMATPVIDGELAFGSYLRGGRTCSGNRRAWTAPGGWVCRHVRRRREHRDRPGRQLWEVLLLGAGQRDLRLRAHDTATSVLAESLGSAAPPSFLPSRSAVILLAMPDGIPTRHSQRLARRACDRRLRLAT